MYLLKFADGLEKKVDEKYAKKIDEMWADKEKSKQVLKFKDGTRVLLSTLTVIQPLNIRNSKDFNAPDPDRIMGYLEAAKTNKPTEKKEQWIKLIKENLERIKKGLTWIYYDKDLKVCTKEEARNSFNIADMSSQLEKDIQEVGI